jgi:hypothetical protein
MRTHRKPILSPEPCMQLVLGSDLAYSPSALPPLRAVLRRLFAAAAAAPPTLLLAHKRRHTPVDEGLLAMLVRCPVCMCARERHRSEV